MSKELMSTANFYTTSQTKDLAFPPFFEYKPGSSSKRIISEMLMAPTKNYYLQPEISLVPQMMKGNNLAHLRKEFENELIGNWGYKPLYFWHLPKFYNYDFARDVPIFLEHFSKWNKTGMLFYTPARYLISPWGEKEYVKFVGNWADQFPEEENHVLTVHDYTIFHRNKKGELQLNTIGDNLREMATHKYKISVELAVEGNFPLLAVPDMGHLEKFLEVCHENNFGLTLDTYNIWMMLKPYGVMIDGYFPFLSKFIALAKEKEVPIHLVHFKPFDLNSDHDALSPAESPFSYDYLRDFLDKQGLGEVPISLEVDEKKLKPMSIAKMTEKLAAQIQMEKLLSR